MQRGKADPSAFAPVPSTRSCPDAGRVCGGGGAASRVSHLPGSVRLSSLGRAVRAETGVCTETDGY